MRDSRRPRFSKRIARFLMAAGAGALLVTAFVAMRFFLPSAKAVSSQAGTVQLAGEQPGVRLNKTAPQRYDGKQRKVVYLTFDDGPSQFQGQILDILKKNNIQATFFMIGRNVPAYKDSVKRLVKEGHYPGLHSMTHDYKRLYTEGQIVAEMQQVQKIVYDVTGVKASLTRCPYGSMPGLVQPLRDAMAAAELKEWDWTIDSLDWKLSGNPNAIVDKVTAGAGKPREVVLLHEKAQTVQALPQMIDNLRQKGYEFEVYHEADHISLNFWHDERL